MAPAPAQLPQRLLPIDTYLHTSYKSDVHFVDGEIEERNVGEYTHSFMQGFFVLAFHRDLASRGT